MSNQNRKGNSGVNPIAIAAGVGLGALAAVGGYLFGRYQESEQAATAAKQRAAAAPAPSQNWSDQGHNSHTCQKDDDDLEKPQRDRECVICFREFKDLMDSDEEIHTTSCGHVFCYNCIHKALVETKRCPVCRAVVDPEHTLRIYL